MKFDYSISHVPGKFLYTSDTLSCAPVDEVITDDGNTEAMVQAIFSLFPAISDHLDEYCKELHANATY